MALIITDHCYSRISFVLQFFAFGEDLGISHQSILMKRNSANRSDNGITNIANIFGSEYSNRHMSVPRTCSDLPIGGANSFRYRFQRFRGNKS